MEQAPTVALGNGAYRLTKYGEFFAVPRGNTSKECQDVDCQTFSVFYILHNHEWVKKSCIVLVAGKIYDIDFMGYLWERFFPVATLGFGV